MLLKWTFSPLFRKWGRRARGSGSSKYDLMTHSAKIFDFKWDSHWSLFSSKSALDVCVRVCEYVVPLDFNENIYFKIAYQKLRIKNMHKWHKQKYHMCFFQVPLLNTFLFSSILSYSFFKSHLKTVRKFSYFLDIFLRNIFFVEAKSNMSKIKQFQKD